MIWRQVLEDMFSNSNQRTHPNTQYMTQEKQSIFPTKPMLQIHRFSKKQGLTDIQNQISFEENFNEISKYLQIFRYLNKHFFIFDATNHILVNQWPFDDLLR